LETKTENITLQSVDSEVAETAEYTRGLTFRLDNFEGPLDLLLFLIQKHKLNINDIPIADLLNQYMEYINDYAKLNMEIAAEFLEMAARLLYIKTASLLPKENESEKLKRELQGRLIELALVKSAARRLKEHLTGLFYTVRRPMKIEADNEYTLTHDKQMLSDAIKGIKVLAVTSEVQTPANPFTDIVHSRFVSVSTQIVHILKELYKKGKCILSELFSAASDRSERVAAFLAVLELTRAGRILLNNDNTIIVFNRG
jgi:segregation and condensation protein A